MVLMRDLLLVHLDNERYGVWKDEILSIRDVQALHRIPLSPACIAGMSIIDGRTVTLADLPVCIGHAAAAQNGKGRILMLASPGKITGFMITGDIDTISVPPHAVVPIPEYLKTEVIDSCAIFESAPIPIVNLVRLCAHLVKADQEPMAPALSFAGKSEETTGETRIRVFELGGELFAAPARSMEDRAIKPGRITALSLLPEYVRGMTVYGDNAVLPVIDLSQRIKRQRCRPDASMIVEEIGGSRFGLLIDDDRGVFPAADILISDLPPVARTFWLARAIVRSGEIIPFLDQAALLLTKQERSGEKPQDHRYTPESGFSEVFKRQDLDIVEFLLLGVRHGLPKSEVEDVIPFTPFRPIPDAPEIVAGVMEHRGTLLPVLDLAMVFGRRSLVKKEWSMMLVRNGDFRAFVVTEAVTGETRLPLDMQRSVPILLPHRVVYGCYPAADGVRLIMNVYAMTVHFEKSLVKELLPALSAEMKMARAEIVHTLLDEPPVAGVAVEVGAAGDGKTDSEQEQHPLPEAAGQLSDVAGLPVSEAEEPAISSAYQNQDGASEPVSVTEAEHMRVKSSELVVAAAPAEAGEPAAESLGPVEQQTAEQTEIPETTETVAEAPVADAAAEEVATVSAAAAPEASAFASEERVLTEDEVQPVEKTEETTQEKPEREVIQPEPALAEPALSMEEPAVAASPGAVAQVEEPRLVAESSPEPQPTRVEADTEKTDAGTGIQEEPQRPVVLQPETVHAGFFNQRPDAAVETARPSRLSQTPSDVSSPGRARGRFWYAVAGALLVALLAFSVFFKKSIPEKRAGENPPQKTAVLKTEESSPRAKSTPSLEIDVPVGRTADIEIYLVVKGDTLWSISERFTGNPFNYPRIAGENMIANPDLIFPGQKIRLLKQ